VRPNHVLILQIETGVQIVKKISYAKAKTVQKSFKILETLCEKQALRPSELANQLKLCRSNVHRLLFTLQDLGYVERLEDSRFRLSFKIFMLGTSIPIRDRITAIARPYMIRLAETSQENVNLALMYDRKVLYIDKIESPHYLKLDQPVGRTDPLHCTSLGKIFLSGFNDQELVAFLKATDLVSYTKNTITDSKTMVNQIRYVRKKGYAVDLEELSEGIRCIGAPIRDHTGNPIAAISISAPTVRLSRERMERLKGPLIETAKEISIRMGYAESGEKGLDRAWRKIAK
jgi:IclR family KDG regulon transcriptional repressor